jgi:hypothetical protein
MNNLTQSEKLEIAIERLSDYKTNDKFGYHYMIKQINHSKYFYSYEQSHTRKEWLALLIEEIKTPEGWSKLVRLSTYKDLQ